MKIGTDGDFTGNIDLGHESAAAQMAGGQRSNMGGVSVSSTDNIVCFADCADCFLEIFLVQAGLAELKNFAPVVGQSLFGTPAVLFAGGFLIFGLRQSGHEGTVGAVTAGINHTHNRGLSGSDVVGQLFQRHMDKIMAVFLLQDIIGYFLFRFRHIWVSGLNGGKDIHLSLLLLGSRIIFIMQYRAEKVKSRTGPFHIITG